MPPIVYRGCVLAVLSAIGIPGKPANAGLVDDMIHRAGFGDIGAVHQSSPSIDEFERLVQHAPIEDPLALGDAQNDSLFVGTTGLDGPLVGDAFVVVPDKRFNLKNPIGPFVRHDSSSLKSNVLPKPIAAASPGANGSLQGTLADADPTNFIVPEPTVLLLLLAGIPAIIGRPSRRRR